MSGIDKYRDVERERAVLHFILTTEDQEYYINQLSEDKFYDRINGHLVKIIRYMDKEEKVISFTSLKDYIQLNEKEINQKRVLEGLKMVYNNPTVCRFKEDVQHLDELHKNRLIDDQVINKTKKMLEENASSVEIIQHIQNSLAKVIIDKSESVSTTAEKVEEEIIRGQQDGQASLKTGLTEFDLAVGIVKKRYFVVAALSSVGKSFWSYDILLRICQNNDKEEIALLYFSLEIPKEDFIMWLACNLACVVFKRLEGGGKKLSDEEMRKVKEALAYIKTLPLKIVSGVNTIDDVTLKTQKFVLENKGKHVVVFLDHHLKVEKVIKDTRQHVSDLSQALASLTTNYEITTILLAQLRRELMDKKYDETDHRPNSSFIQESGSLFQDANHVMCLWRPEMYRNPVHLPSMHAMHLIVEKNKNGDKDFDIILDCIPKYAQLFNPTDENPFSDSKPNQWDKEGLKEEEDDKDEVDTGLPF